jgi:hypothetical protein
MKQREALSMRNLALKKEENPPPVTPFDVRKNEVSGDDVT